MTSLEENHIVLPQAFSCVSATTQLLRFSPSVSQTDFAQEENGLHNFFYITRLINVLIKSNCYQVITLLVTVTY